MKILDRYILTTFIKTFLSVFAILYFIFVLQGVWVFIAELAGKDLDVLTIVKFLFYYSPKMIPMVLPLSVLLASIMTFGDFSENYEFAAMKSAGISLQRAMRSLIIFILILAGISFWFVNDVAPKSEFKFVNLRKDILHTKPAMAITAGQFNDLGNINIKVDEKTGDRGQHLKNVTMHIKSNSNFENKTVIKAEKGELETDDNSSILQLHLFNGNYYEDVSPSTNSNVSQNKVPFVKTYFEKYTINIDLSQFDNSEEEKIEITNTASMMSINQLNYTLDSLNNNFRDENKSNLDNLGIRVNTQLSNLMINKLDSLPQVSKKIEIIEIIEIIDKQSKNTKSQIYRLASSNVESIYYTLKNNEQNMLEKQKNINKHYISFYEKFVVAFSCLLMFFIGAPLGAIIRKGGLGLPMVFAVLIFITYHFINTFGRKLAQENGIPPVLGAWLSTLVLLPLAISFTSKATKDRGINSFDNIIYSVKEFFKKTFNKKQNKNV
ncbi:LptF/LptG family permease [Flavobacterium sp. I3-2]|uniref:LptF/LptG family permease n=1 Tax=Flavobacterium sp. I3-2 TaxID=2748319 RepID=UPI0015AC249B|nr:LptF/LptG family permease [Flavobacterium sp. I3-2]